MGKTLNNTDTKGATKQVRDIEFWGDGDSFKLLSKASSKNEKWMKSTKAMEVQDHGVVLQITTQQGDNVAETCTFIEGVRIVEFKDDEGKIIGRKLENFQNCFELNEIIRKLSKKNDELKKEIKKLKKK